MRLSFHGFTFDPQARELLRKGRPVALTPKAFRLLEVLLERRPSAVSKKDLMDLVWPEVHVVEGNLASLVSEIRGALREEDQDLQLIRTVHRVGYAFVGAAVQADPSPRAPRSSPCRLVSSHAEIFLFEGENLIGRDGAGVIRIDSVGVSRLHARITVRGPAVTIEDLGSKNGTHVAGVKIHGPVALQEGSAIRLGNAEFVLRTSLDGETVTFDGVEVGVGAELRSRGEPG